MTQRITVRDIANMKANGDKVPMLTAYDYTTARLADRAGIPMLLVGDSLGMVVLGYESTIPVTMDEMLHHIKAVSRGAERAMLVGDLPFMTYQINSDQALHNASKFIQEGGAHGVKLEGGEEVAEQVHRIVECGIPVMGHIGLTPQSVNRFGGYRVRGKEKEEAAQLIRDAIALEQAGAFAIVLELVPGFLSRLITGRLSIPTIGIGAGPHCDGHVQVVNDLLGLYTDFVPKHARAYARLAETVADALHQYASDVHDGSFSAKEECFNIDESILEEIESASDILFHHGG